jgi:hypothetical protein
MTLGTEKVERSAAEQSDFMRAVRGAAEAQALAALRHIQECEPEAYCSRPGGRDADGRLLPSRDAAVLGFLLSRGWVTKTRIPNPTPGASAWDRTEWRITDAGRLALEGKAEPVEREPMRSGLDKLTDEGYFDE